MEILFEDKQVLVLYKPAGIPVQSGRVGTKDLVSMVKNYLAGESRREPYVGLVHRLDQPVEGLIVFAKTRQAAADLSAQAAGHEMKKEYLAVVCGIPKNEEGTLRDLLIKEREGNRSRIARPGESGAREAALTYRVLAKKEERALLRIRLLTGRHHQIRVQMAHAGFPLYGDNKYNPDFSDTEYRVQPALCAAGLAFQNPTTQKRSEFEIVPRNPIFAEFIE